MKDIIKKITYIVTVFVIIGVALFNAFMVPVMASTEVESLPRTDINVDVSYDSSNMYLNYDSNMYTIPFHYDMRYRDENGGPYDMWLFWHDLNGNTVEYSNQWGFIAKWTDMNAYGNLLSFSFWFSPSENRVYVFTHADSDSVIESYSGSTFHFSSDSQYYTSVNYWNLSDMSFHRLGQLANSTTRKINGSTVYYRVSSGDIISGYVDSSYAWNYFPKDLLCVYSNYEISGFYEFDNSSIHTPIYYFKYQYLFYVEGVGYTFIDSASPLDKIVDMQNGYSFMYFKEKCNAHTYTSSDGITWQNNTSVVGMYALYQQIDYKYFYDNVGGSMIAKLVYTTDNEYGIEPILPPEFLEEYFSSEVFDVEQIIYLLDYSINYPKGEVPEADKNWFDVLVYATQSFKGDIVSFYRYYQSLQDDSLVKEFTNFIEQQTILKSFTEDYVFEYVFHDDGTYTPIHKVSLYGFVKLMNKSLINIDTDLNNIQLNLHNDLKSVFDNISLTNSYMKSIDLAISDLPDYTKQFNESIGIQKDILAALEEIEGSSGSNPSVSNPSVSTNFDMVVFENWMNELDKSIDTIAKVEVFDEITDSTDIVGDVVDNAFDEVFDFEKAPVLSKGADEVSGMISGAISQLATGSILIGAFDYASNITSGVGFINANVNNFYEASSVMKPVFLSGAAMFVVNLVLRRKE